MLWKDGKKKALTLSYDDGVIHDRRFVELLNKYGIKCTFNLNSECFEEESLHIEANEKPVADHVHRNISKEEVKSLYSGHEVASHSCTHPRLVGLSAEEVKREIEEDMKNLCSLSGQEKVIGFAYPYGVYDEELMERLKSHGIVYARTVNDSYDFGYPEDFLAWHPTIHHKKKELMELANKFIASDNDGDLFYLWGHSYEFYEDGNWDELEEFLKLMKAHEPDIWFATNIEIYNYINENK